MGPFWLYSRLYLIPPKQFIESQNVNQVDLRSKRHSICQKSLTRNLSRFPGNCILELHSVRKSLAVSNWPEYLNGFRIGHISDLHFTGQLSPEFYRFALEELVALRPDMIAITGDIIDKAHCLPWIEELLGSLRAPHGCFFVLGNHDKRIADPNMVRRLLEQSGWVDLGSRVYELEVHGQRVLLAGHELPWFGEEASFGTDTTGSESVPAFRLALSHSPDAIDWAQKERVDLLLSGHTHGGQIRFPLIGPVVAPSWYGSQFASGVFYRKPTLMHVSRGLAGVHPLRFRCHPEIALLELYASSKG
jgi:predicted MPP superfamily phosphohydrolase